MRLWVILRRSWNSGCHGRDGGSPLRGTEGPPVWPPRQPLARPCASGAGGSAGAHPAALSACSNSGRSWTWRSSSTSGAPRWVLPAADTITVSPGEGAGGSWEAWGLLCPLSPPLLPCGTQAWGTPPRGHPVPRPCPGWGGRAGPCTLSARGEGGSRSALPRSAQAARVPLCVAVSVVSSLLSVPLSQTLLPARGRCRGLSRDPRTQRGPRPRLSISALRQPHLLRQLS